jgi:hypothetical protein
MKYSPQMTVGKIIKDLESMNLKMENGEDKIVVFDFCNFSPTTLDSWRGSYDELALGYHDIYKEVKAKDLLNNFKEAIGKTFIGYKGGEFIMNKDTPLWVANYGHSGNTGIIGIVDNDYEIIIMTSWCEF